MFPSQNLLLVWVKVAPESIQTEDGFTRDVSSIGHWGTGDLEITLRTMSNLEKARPLLEKSYESS
jgi:predicted transport protein